MVMVVVAAGQIHRLRFCTLLQHVKACDRQRSIASVDHPFNASGTGDIAGAGHQRPNRCLGMPAADSESPAAGNRAEAATVAVAH